MRKIRHGVLLLLMIWCLDPRATVLAQRPDGYPPPAGAAAQPEASPPEAGSGESLGDILAAGGLVGLLIVLVSLAAVALVFEHVMTIRATVLMPPGLADDVHELLADGRVADALAQCRAEPSLLGHVLGAGLAEVDGGWPAVEKAMEDATAEQSARLFRKIARVDVLGLSVWQRDCDVQLSVANGIVVLVLQERCERH